MNDTLGELVLDQPQILILSISDEMPIRMSSCPTRMNMMGILPKIGTGYLTFENNLIQMKSPCKNVDAQRDD
jgi:hypothetical protein